MIGMLKTKLSKIGTTMNRRVFINHSLKAMGALGLTGFYSWQIEPEWVEYTQTVLPLQRSKNHLNSTQKILIQISDLHIGNRFNLNYFYEAFKKVNHLQPDFVVYTGDFVQYENSEQFKQLQKIAPYFPKGTLGTIAVLGNHDYGKKFKEENVARTIQSILQENGLTVLRNEQIEINNISFIGIDDLWGTNFNPQPLVSKIDKTKEHIILCHNPDVYDLPIMRNLKGVMLSGHTHGGQVKPPFLPPFIIPVKNKNYTSGWVHKDKDLKMYINKGLGNLWKLRFNVRPEITKFTFV